MTEHAVTIEAVRSAVELVRLITGAHTGAKAKLQEVATQYLIKFYERQTFVILDKPASPSSANLTLAELEKFLHAARHDNAP